MSGVVLAPEARTDPTSGSPELFPHVASGGGTLVSWTVVHRAPLPVLAASVHYMSAVVELDEGPWLMVRLLADEPGRLRAGDRVQVCFLRSGDDDQEGEVALVFEAQAKAQ